VATKPWGKVQELRRAKAKLEAVQAGQQPPFREFAHCERTVWRIE
jgi:hypothetical protein